MNYQIIKILPEKKARMGGNSYIRVEFLDEAKDWYKTDLCRNYRNFSRWAGLLKVGTIITGVQLLNKDSIDADSYPKFVGRDKIKMPEALPKPEPKPEPKNLTLL